MATTLKSSNTPVYEKGNHFHDAHPDYFDTTCDVCTCENIWQTSTPTGQMVQFFKLFCIHV